MQPATQSIVLHGIAIISNVEVSMLKNNVFPDVYRLYILIKTTSCQNYPYLSL